MGVTIKKVPGIAVGYNFKGKGTLSIGGVEVGKVSDMKVAVEGTHLPTVMGIDVSTDTGIVVLQWDSVLQAWRTKADFEINLPSLPKKATMQQRTERARFLMQQITTVLSEYHLSAVAIEGYGYANANSLVTLVEFGVVVRLALPVMSSYEVAPASLKKFILGKGVGKKEQVMMQVFKKWGYEAKTNNLADAYVLAHIAAAVHGPYPVALTKPQLEVISVVKAKNA